MICVDFQLSICFTILCPLMVIKSLQLPVNKNQNFWVLISQMNIQKSTIPCLCLSPYLIQIPICTTPSHPPLRWRHLWIPQTPAHKTSSRAASNFFPLNTPHLRSFPVIYKRVEKTENTREREKKNFYHFLFTRLKICFDG